MKKRLFAMLMCILMVLALLPTAALADDPATRVWIFGKELSSLNPFYHAGENGSIGEVNANPSGADAIYSGDGTLFIYDLVVTDSTAVADNGVNCGLFANGDLIIEVYGSDNVIEVAHQQGDNANAGAILVAGDLTVIAGEGSEDCTLKAIANGVEDERTGIGDSMCVGVYTGGALTVNGGVTLEGRISGKAESNSCYVMGVSATEISVYGGTLIGVCEEGAYCRDSTSFSRCFGMFSDTNLHVTGGSVLGTSGRVQEAFISNTGGGAGSNGYNAGVYVENTVTISGGTLEGASRNTEGAVNESFGIFARCINATGGEVDGRAVSAPFACQTSAGIKVEKTEVRSGNLSVSYDARVIGNGSIAEDLSCGMIVEGDLVFEGDLINTSGGDINPNTSETIRSAGLLSGGSITVNDGIFTATGGLIDTEGGFGSSYGILSEVEEGTALSVNGGEFFANGGEAPVTSYGVFTEGGSISIAGGYARAAAGAEGLPNGAAALSQAPTLGSGIAAKGSTAVNGTPRENYSAALNANYLWFYAGDRPALSVAASPAEGIEPGDTVTLTATPAHISNPTYRWYFNTTNGTVDGTLISGATSATYTPPTDTIGTVYYYCVAGGTQTFLGIAVDDAFSNVVAVTVAVPEEYKVTRGANGKWTRGGTKDLGFTADGNFEDFTGVYVDGEELSTDNYTAVSGSTVVTLKAAYLETLTAGQHTLRIVYTDGFAETHFTVNAAVPPTGDSANPALWLAIALTALIAGLTFLYRRRQTAVN